MGARVVHSMPIVMPVHVCISENPEHKFARDAKDLGVPVVTFKWMFECPRTKTELSLPTSSHTYDSVGGSYSSKQYPQD